MRATKSPSSKADKPSEKKKPEKKEEKKKPEKKEKKKPEKKEDKKKPERNEEKMKSEKAKDASEPAETESKTTKASESSKTPASPAPKEDGATNGDTRRSSKATTVSQGSPCPIYSFNDSGTLRSYFFNCTTSHNLTAHSAHQCH